MVSGVATGLHSRNQLGNSPILLSPRQYRKSYAELENEPAFLEAVSRTFHDMHRGSKIEPADALPSAIKYPDRIPLRRTEDLTRLRRRIVYEFF